MPSTRDERPTTFDAKEGDGQTISVFKRVKETDKSRNDSRKPDAGKVREAVKPGQHGKGRDPISDPIAKIIREPINSYFRAQDRIKALQIKRQGVTKAVNGPSRLPAAPTVNEIPERFTRRLNV